jgi:hypothetical protein
LTGGRADHKFLYLCVLCADLEVVLIVEFNKVVEFIPSRNTDFLVGFITRYEHRELTVCKAYEKTKRCLVRFEQEILYYGHDVVCHGYCGSRARRDSCTFSGGYCALRQAAAGVECN